ncbi:Permease of the drug/metabolite transporter (DMT) superfamily [Nonomuraea wenchangensis]|uniref:Permease of the drug/metabolite transporter (DMT) superfamily n=1 Tax=Nonomuraea wenchangensis TaxID=568860 RepID=A0A1I0LT74_9ACTN|nr:Permease of the drug/metabolite transporter (DMT) superfamily [Nonomuraea wenchangensis]
MAGVPAPRPLLGAVLLLFVSAAWGSAFPLMKDLIHRLPVEDLLAERYLLAALTLLLIRPRCLRGLPRETWINGVILGIMFGVGQTAQAVALHGLPSAVSGFAVGCSVVITPILALLIHKARVQTRIWYGVVFALAGMTAFTLMRGVEEHEISLIALAATLAAAALYSGHTLMLGQISKHRVFQPYALTAIQLATIGLTTGVAGARDGITLPSSGPDWLLLAHLSVVSCALGFLARSYGQAHVPAIPSAVLMSSQPVFVALIAVIWFHEQVGWSMVVGGGLMAAAMLLAVPARATADKRADAPERADAPDKRRGPGRRELLDLSRRAARVLSDLRVKRDESPPPCAGPTPIIAKSACVDTASCPWHTRSLKGGGEPSLERLIERATLIVRARSLPGPGCCRSVTLLGRCLCELMEESERRRMESSPRWFGTK